MRDTGRALMMRNNTQTGNATNSALPIEAAHLQRLDVTDLLRLLRISRATLSRRMATGEIEFQRDGGRVFFTTDAIERYQAKLRRNVAGKVTTM